MPSKLQLDKIAWQWTETVEPADVKQEHIEAAYRVRCSSCSANACRRNCSGNPRCLSGLGERNWLQELKDSAWHDVGDPNAERRPEGGFVGLKNLGATCYLNSFLQVLYHNPAFRHSLYQWDPQDDPQECFKQVISNEKKELTVPSATGPCATYRPSSVTGHLQLLFAQLQFSKRRYIDPEPFITCLGLSTTQQQDAQEFSKLLMCLLEKHLSSQRQLSARTIVQEQYAGEYDYVTKCLECSTESLCPSKFYELDLNIKGLRHLEEALNQFLREEKLEGSNQYSCGVCGGMRNAVRCIRLRRLPPVLNLQLLRFGFDRQAGCRKINTALQFTETLDLSAHLRKPPGSMVYTLMAVLIHQGSSANSGHYVAHIKDRTSGSWYLFNDDGVCKMRGRHLQLNTDEENPTRAQSAGSDDASEPPKRLAKGTHDSTGAYMLVYQKSGHTNSFPADQDPFWAYALPKIVQEALDTDNAVFEQWVAEMDAMRADKVSAGRAQQKEVRSLYEQLPVIEGEPVDWIATDWLIKWLAQDKEPVPPVDNSAVLCTHSLLDPQHVSKVKCISSRAADLIYQKYGGGPRLREALCASCVVQQCRYLRAHTRVQDDQRNISRLLKFKPSSTESSMWVGKQSLLWWRKLAMAQVASPSQETNGNDTGPIEDDPETTLPPVSAATFSFNEDICCPHGGLNPNKNIRRLVGMDVWTLLKGHFSSAPQFPESTEDCQQCLAHQMEDSAAQVAQKQQAAQERQQFADLVQERNRPDLSESAARLLARHFLSQWKLFLRYPLVKERPTNIVNTDLLCPHGLLLHLPQDEDRAVAIWPQEWESLVKLFPVDLCITVSPGAEEGKLITEPALCESCRESADLERRQSQQGTVLVRRVSSQEAEASAKRPRLDERRQRRARRGDRSVHIRATQTLLDLKLKVMELFSVAPFDQHLSLDQGDGQPPLSLSGNSSTLAELGVLPGALLLLVVDEPAGEIEDCDQSGADQSTGMGFKGTKLQE